MGADARVDIWVGLKFDDTEIDELFTEDVTERFHAYESFDLDTGEWGQWLDNRPILEAFKCSEEIAGVGVGVFGHDWDFGTKEINLQELHEKAMALLPIVKAALETLGVHEEPHVYIQTDYS